MKKFLPLVLFMVVLACASINAPSQVEAAIDWRSSWNSGYSMTTNYQGITVPIGTEVTAYAGTVRPSSEVDRVVFRWLRPNGSPAWISLALPLDQDGGTWDGHPIRYAENKLTINEVGNWGVQAIFYKDSIPVITFPPNNELEAIRAASFFAVPEVPLGTITATLTMITTLAVIAVRKKSNRTLTAPTI